MSNTEIVNETADIDDIELHEVYVYIADDNMSASVRLGKCDEGYTSVSYTHLTLPTT